MKIAYIFTATGKYSRFIDEVVKSGTEKFFSKEHVDFIVFTDDVSYKDKYVNLKTVFQEKLGWPYDTLMRFHLINRIKEELNYDYIFFGNANISFFSNVSYEILPENGDNGLVGTAHPLQNKQPKELFSYERSKNSLAYVPHGDEIETYYQGCFFGGERNSFLKMVHELKNNIQIDLKNNVIPIWWDESHMNRYFIDNRPKTLHSGYAYPESIKIDHEPKIIQLDKTKFGGHDFLRTK